MQWPPALAQQRKGSVERSESWAHADDYLGTIVRCASGQARRLCKCCDAVNRALPLCGCNGSVNGKERERERANNNARKKGSNNALQTFIRGRGRGRDAAYCDKVKNGAGLGSTVGRH
jgi:hypothetical protein